MIQFTHIWKEHISTNDINDIATESETMIHRQHLTFVILEETDNEYPTEDN